MLHQAYELGLETCWIGAFSEDEVKSVLRRSEACSGCCLVALRISRDGYYGAISDEPR